MNNKWRKYNQIWKLKLKKLVNYKINYFNKRDNTFNSYKKVKIIHLNYRRQLRKKNKIRLINKNNWKIKILKFIEKVPKLQILEIY
jgi:hypothetical protein